MGSKNKTAKQKKQIRRVKPQPKLNDAAKQAFAQATQAHQIGQLPLAKSIYLQVLNHYSNHAESHYFLGLIYFRENDYRSSELHLRSAADLIPTNIKYQQSLGEILLRNGALGAAEEVFQHALNLAPKSSMPLYNLASVKQKLNKHPEALALFNRAIDANPKFAPSWNNRGSALLGLCLVSEACASYKKSFELAPNSTALSNLLFSTNYDSTLTGDQVFQTHLKYKELIAGEKLEHSKSKGTKIKIGFLSPDFRNHSVAYFLKPLFNNIDFEQVALHCYYNSDTIDNMTSFFKEKSNSWCDCSLMSEQQLLGKIREDQLDVLIDLAGHTLKNRASVFAHRAAPIQINWLGYPHSTGIDAMDYRFVDEITDPSPSADALASEKLLRLPHGFLCYEGDASVDYQSATPFARNGFISFGSFNNLLKVNDEVVETWCDILKRTPNSRIILKSKQFDEPSVKQRYENLFTHHGIDLARVDLVAYVDSTAGHLSLYNEIDLALDTFPYNGTTTTCEALWMGVPTVTYLGDVHAARVSASILCHAGLPEFIAQDKNDYIEKAVAYATAPEALAKLRPSLREQMQNSALCDAPRFAKDFVDTLKECL